LDQELIGINKTRVVKIQYYFANNDVEDLTFFVNQTHHFHESNLEKKKLEFKSIVWRGDEPNFNIRVGYF